MRTKNWILGMCCLAVVACKEEKHPQLPRTAGGELVYMVADSLLTEEERELKAEYIHVVPDYLLTEEEEEVKRARLKKWKEEVEDKHFQFDSTTKLRTFDMTLEEFLWTGFQEAEYWETKRRIAHYNRWIKDTMPEFEAKIKALFRTVSPTEAAAMPKDTLPKSHFTNRNKVIPAWVREEVSAEEYKMIERLNERYDLFFDLWEGELAELVERTPKEKNRATLDFLLNATIAPEFSQEVLPVEMQEAGENLYRCTQTNVLWRATAGTAEVHLDMVATYTYDEKQQRAEQPEGRLININFDAEDLELGWKDRASFGGLTQDGKAYEALLTGNLRGEVDLGKRLHITVELRNFYNQLRVRILPESGAEDAAVVWGRQPTMYHL